MYVLGAYVYDFSCPYFVQPKVGKYDGKWLHSSAEELAQAYKCATLHRDVNAT